MEHPPAFCITTLLTDSIHAGLVQDIPVLDSSALDMGAIKGICPDPDGSASFGVRPD